MGALPRNPERSRDSPFLLSVVIRRGDACREADLGAAGLSPRLVILRHLLSAAATLLGTRGAVGLAGVVVAATTPAGQRVRAAAAARFVRRFGLGRAGRSLDARQRGDTRCGCHRDRKNDQKSDVHPFSIVRQDQASGPIPFSAARTASLEALRCTVCFDRRRTCKVGLTSSTSIELDRTVGGAMRRISCIYLAVLAGGSALLPEVGLLAAEPDVADYFQARCAQCHTVPDPAIRTDLAWLDQVERTA